MLVVLVATLATGCATATRGVPVGGGWRMHVGFESNTVIVTNATTLPGDLFLNGGFVTTLKIGDTFTLRLGGVVRNNVILFKSFSEDATGGKILHGVVSSSYQGGAGQTYEWTIRYTQPIR
jgi:hypothetical protein